MLLCVSLAPQASAVTDRSLRDSRLVPQRLGAEEATLVSRKYEAFELDFAAQLSNDACAPGMCAPAAQLELGGPATWLSFPDVQQLKVVI